MKKKKPAAKKDYVENAFSVAMRSVGIDQSAPSPTVIALNDSDIRRQIMREMGSRGGKKGGKARAQNLTAKQRSKIAKRAAKARWKK